jgi:aspartate aminotransferase
MTAHGGVPVRKPVSLNLNVRGLGHSATLAIKARCRALRAEGRPVVDFGLGQSPFPVPRPVVEALRRSAAEKDYLPVEGLPALREAVAGFHQRNDRVDIRPEDVLVGPGSKELMFLLQLVYYGEIILRSPCWVSYLPQAQIIGRRISLIPTRFEDNWKITPSLLRDSLRGAGDDHRPRLLILNYPSNPTGHTYSADELEALTEVAREFDLIVLSDEIYGQTHFTNGHVSIARFYPERTIISSGLSKWCGAGGWRLGTFSFPPELDWLRQAMAAVASESYTSVSAPIQFAAVEAFSANPEIDRYLFHVRRILAAVAERSVAILRPSGLRVHAPTGAFYLFLDFTPLAAHLATRGIRTSADLCERLLTDTGVAILPGAHFGRPTEELTARLSYVDFDGGQALEQSEALTGEADGAQQVVDRHCQRLLGGMEAMVGWLGR